MAKKVKLYLQVGGTLVKTKNVPIVDELIIGRLPEIQHAIESDTYPLDIYVVTETYDQVARSLRRYGSKADLSKSISIYYGGIDSKPICKFVRTTEEQIDRMNEEGERKAKEGLEDRLKEMTKAQLVNEICLCQNDQSEENSKKLMRKTKDQLIELLCGYLNS